MSTAIAKKQRIAWIDIAKGFTILTVIWGHTLAAGSALRNVIFSFHMPLFFILSGFTLKPAKDAEDLVSRTKKDFLRLIVPVILMLVIASILHVIFFNSSATVESYQLLYKLFWANGLPLEAGMPSMGMPWFLVALFMSKFLLRLFSLLFKKDFELIGIFCGFVGMTLSAKHIWLPLNLDTALVCMIFVAVGMLAHKYLSLLTRYKLPLFFISLFFTYYALSHGQYIEFAAHLYNPYLIIEGLASSFIVCIICNAISPIKPIHKTFCFIGINTMPIFLMHHMDYFAPFLYQNNNMYISCLLRTFWVLLFAFVFTFIYRWGKKKIIAFCNSRRITN